MKLSASGTVDSILKLVVKKTDHTRNADMNRLILVDIP